MHDSKIAHYKAWTFTDEIPNFLEIDISKVHPELPIQIKDVEKSLPKHMHVHKDMIKEWDTKIFEIEPEDDNFMYDREFSKDLPTREELDLSQQMNALGEDPDKRDDEKPFHVPKIPFRKASGKVLAATKDMGSTRESIEEYLEAKRQARIKIGRIRPEYDDSDDDYE